jgi:uncharacterized peroxidase-related enzyme
MAFIETIEPSNAQGELKDIYDDLLKSRGKIAEVHKIQSLNPPTIIHHMELYMTIMYGKSPVKRVLREILGVIVSMANQCEYCTEHHAVAVNHYWKDSDRIERLKRDFNRADLNQNELVLCEYAHDLTLNPGNSQDGSWVNKLQDAGYSDREILDATLVCAYFNFVNRMVLSLGATTSEEEVSGYKYDSQD